MELRIYFLRKFTLIEKSDFLQKFYTTKIWSYIYGMASCEITIGVRMHGVYNMKHTCL